ncbi:hypothetical protein CDAR_297101 [Caerostris darwini]|uniref:Uncharacterized protein n=1 Tax=Caerostris darwini TaxID=1538125 RepID=A0AAV4QCD7_9ARAC|nr:hypothetical protein CDAR_297101 [Caerostris darwini]
MAATRKGRSTFFFFVTKTTHPLSHSRGSSSCGGGRALKPLDHRGESRFHSLHVTRTPVGTFQKWYSSAFASLQEMSSEDPHIKPNSIRTGMTCLSGAEPPSLDSRFEWILNNRDCRLMRM